METWGSPLHSYPGLKVEGEGTLDQRVKISSLISPDREKYEIINALREVGYEVILSIGELEENNIGSNCGQYITNYLREKKSIKSGYTYPIQKV